MFEKVVLKLNLYRDLCLFASGFGKDPASVFFLRGIQYNYYLKVYISSVCSISDVCFYFCMHKTKWPDYVNNIAVVQPIGRIIVENDLKTSTKLFFPLKNTYSKPLVNVIAEIK